jgi:B12-binding domain/radical SAM domain protein
MTPHLVEVRAEAAALRAGAPGALLLAGGSHASADPEGTLALGFDHVFAGEAENTFPAFLSGGCRGAPIIRDAQGGPDDLDGVSAFGPGRWGPVEITRGCRYDCSFCAVPSGVVRHRTRRAVLGEARALAAMGRHKIAFITPDALSYGGSLGELDALLADLRSAGMNPVLGTFPSEVRPDRVTAEAVEILGRHCGNRTLVIGAQSGSDAVLARLRRGHTVEDVERAASVARQGGFTPHVDVIFGLPGEEAHEQAATVKLAQRLLGETGARIHAHYFHPLPGTRYWACDPSPLGDEARAFLHGLRRAGVEDGWWQEQERWAWQIVEWAERGWIRTPR